MVKAAANIVVKREHLQMVRIAVKRESICKWRLNKTLQMDKGGNAT